MKIFITGHRGFIGKRLTQYLTGLKIQDSKIEIRGFDLVEGYDIRNKFQLDREVEMYQPDIIIHLSALAGVRRGETYPDEYYSTNVQGTQNVFDVAKKHNVKKVIHFSSSSVLGKGDGPISVYGISKYAGEVIARHFRKDMLVDIVRPFTVYGEDGRQDQVIYKWINQVKNGGVITLYGDGSMTRNYTYVGDICNAVAQMVGVDFGEDYDIGGDKDIPLDDVVKLFQEKGDYPLVHLPQPEQDPDHQYPNTTNAKEKLGWKPQGVFHDVVRQILEKEL